MNASPSVADTVISGIGVGRGVVVGPVVRHRSAQHPRMDDPTPQDTESAVAAVTAAFAAVTQALRQRAGGAQGALHDVLAATAMMAEDPALVGEVVEAIRGGTTPTLAVHLVVERYADTFTRAGGYLADRVTDLVSVRDRVIARLQGLPEPGVPELSVPSVVVATDLSPADTAALDPTRVLAIVLEQGGPTGHTAIIASQLGLPAVVRAPGAADLVDGDVVLVDAAHGTVLKDPDEASVKAAQGRRAVLAGLAQATSEGATQDGHRVQLLANIGTVQDAERLIETPVEGVGLFRTEVLFLGAAAAPLIEAQTDAYTRVLTALGDRKVVIRTLDAGADKPLAFVTQPGEENPALGVRGYRLARSAPHLLTTQLDAIARAGAQAGNQAWVMAPMIATAREASTFAAAAHAAGIDMAGVMVEIPAAALRANALLAEVDFVSLGTNDLAQYAMATDRLRGELADLLDIWQPAVLDLIAMTAQAGLEQGKPVGVCGESAADPVMALVLTGMGVTSLSMSPAAVPAVRYALRSHSLDRCQRIARAALAANDATQARAAAHALVDPAVREALALA